MLLYFVKIGFLKQKRERSCGGHVKMPKTNRNTSPRPFPEENKRFKLFWLIFEWGFGNGRFVEKSKVDFEISGS